MSGSKAPLRLWIPTAGVAVFSVLAGTASTPTGVAINLAVAFVWACLIRMTVRTAIMAARSDEHFQTLTGTEP